MLNYKDLTRQRYIGGRTGTGEWEERRDGNLWSVCKVNEKNAN